MSERLKNIHPGEVLKEEFIIPMKITAYRLSKETGISQTALSDIIKCKRKITAQVALKLSKFFGTTPQFWLGLQDDFDIEEESQLIQSDLDKIHSIKELHIADF